MWDFSLLRALGLMIRTLFFVLYRLGICCGLAVAVAVVTGIGLEVGRSLGDVGDEVAAGRWGGAAGVLLSLASLQLLRGTLLFRVTAGHIALMIEVFEGRHVPFSRTQVTLAGEIVAERHGRPSALLALYRLIRGVMRSSTDLIGDMAPMVPLPVFNRLTESPRVYRRLASGLLETVVLAHATRTRSENAWEAAHDGLVLYVQNARAFLTNAAWLNLASWAAAGVVFLLALSPASVLAELGPDASFTGPLMAALLAWAVRASVLQPVAQACLLHVYFRVTEGQEPLPEWRGQLTHVSEKFRSLGEQAIGLNARATRDA
jgi:hypothetical protein